MFRTFTDLYISNGFDYQEAVSEIYFILEILFNYTYKDFLLNKKLKKEQAEKALEIFNERVRTGKPIQQIAEKSYFYGRIFFLNKFTLIPRPETELLVCEVLKISEKNKELEVLDIGTGTGCIGLTLMLENKQIKADMSDIQIEALEIAKKNANFHNIAENAFFIQSDLFENITKKYDIIVSNPPYIPINEKDSLQKEVKEYESAKALFAVDKDGIYFYKKIIAECKNYLKKNGIIAFEIGINQSEKVAEMLKNSGFTEIQIIQDYNGIKRVIIAKLL